MTGVFYVPLRQQESGTDTELESAHKVSSGEENSPAAPAGIQNHNLSIMSLVLYQQAIYKCSNVMSSYAKLYINVVLSVVIMTMSINISHTKSELDWIGYVIVLQSFNLTGSPLNARYGSPLNAHYGSPLNALQTHEKHSVHHLSCPCLRLMLQSLNLYDQHHRQKTTCSLPAIWLTNTHYNNGVVPKGLLTFLGSLYKESTTSGTWIYRFERQTSRKNISSFQKHCPQLRM